ncbi:polymorphic toxin-type HINT domain-containing protein [Nocardiopsis sp. N85]|uniref:polymorphic toxin-type HINT domain-containing protein n=1 Tax=Nocardiopsis sp. N85 TaxID=3029400 RepID=UPI00237F93A4|nr:polymorphic toxin-type HINT domain-containing protein [Nocardiopsis sp. N85]MDE3722892.1 polymorphic toxin-type HINT domain-containing protein [Nocardiopsis sp. N85]
MIVATDGHAFWVPESKSWVDAIDLAPGMWLQTSAGTWVQINAIQAWSQPATVHNLTVQGVHTYHVLAGKTPALVHNSNGKCGPKISTRNEKAGDIGKYTDGQKTRDPASQWYHEELSNEELLDGINNAGAGDGIIVSRDGTILGGHY